MDRVNYRVALLSALLAPLVGLPAPVPPHHDTPPPDPSPRPVLALRVGPLAGLLVEQPPLPGILGTTGAKAVERIENLLGEAARKVGLEKKILRDALAQAIFNVALVTPPSPPGRLDVVMRVDLPRLSLSAIRALLALGEDQGVWGLKETGGTTGVLTLPGSPLLSYQITSERFFAASTPRLLRALRTAGRRGDSLPWFLPAPVGSAPPAELLVTWGPLEDRSPIITTLGGLSALSGISLSYDRRSLNLRFLPRHNAPSQSPPPTATANLSLVLPPRLLLASGGSLWTLARNLGIAGRGTGASRNGPDTHTVCGTNLQVLGEFLKRYAAENGDTIPGGGYSGIATLQNIAEAYGDAVPANVFGCPVRGAGEPFRLPNGVLRITHTSSSYRARAPSSALDGLPPATILLYETRSFDGSGRWVLRGDFKAEWLEESIFKTRARKQNLFGLPPSLR